MYYKGEEELRMVLILEDNENVQILLRKIFASLEIHSSLFITDSIREAYAAAVDDFIDLFVVDIVLDHGRSTDVSGITFVERIRTIEHYKLIPVVFITGLEDPKLYAYSQLHCYSYLEKPFDFRKTVNLFREILKYTRIRPEITENFYFRKDGVLYSVETRKIVFIEIRAKKLYLKCEDDLVILPYVPLSRFAKDLDPRYFLQCSRSTIVNRRYISSVDTVNNYISLKRELGRLDIGRVMKSEFMNRLRSE